MPETSRSAGRAFSEQQAEAIGRLKANAEYFGRDIDLVAAYIASLEEQVEKLLDEYTVLETLAVRCISPNGGGSYTQQEALAEMERQLRGKS